MKALMRVIAIAVCLGGLLQSGDLEAETRFGQGPAGSTHLECPEGQNSLWSFKIRGHESESSHGYPEIVCNSVKARALDEYNFHTEHVKRLCEGELNKGKLLIGKRTHEADPVTCDKASENYTMGMTFSHTFESEALCCRDEEQEDPDPNPPINPNDQDEFCKVRKGDDWESVEFKNQFSYSYVLGLSNYYYVKSCDASVRPRGGGSSRTLWDEAEVAYQEDLDTKSRQCSRVGGTMEILYKPPFRSCYPIAPGGGSQAPYQAKISNEVVCCRKTKGVEGPDSTKSAETLIDP